MSSFVFGVALKIPLYFFLKKNTLRTEPSWCSVAILQSEQVRVRKIGASAIFPPPPLHAELFVQRFVPAPPSWDW